MKNLLLTTLLLLSAALVTGCGGKYTVEGRVDVVVQVDLSSTYAFFLEEICDGDRECADENFQNFLNAVVGGL